MFGSNSINLTDLLFARHAGIFFGDRYVDLRHLEPAMCWNHRHWPDYCRRTNSPCRGTGSNIKMMA